MAQSGEFDPIAAWQQFVGTWERQVNEMSARFSASEEFSGPMNQAAKLGLAARQSMDQAMEKLATSMQLATHAQLQSVLERLDRIEERIDSIAAAVAPQVMRQPSAVAPKRTRRPPEGSA